MRLAPFVLALLALGAHAQTTVRGRVTDATTGAGLYAATLQVPTTSRGTITNREGDFELTVPAGADSVVVRFVGYETARRAVPEDGRLDVALAPVVATLEEAVVRAGTPAENVMRRVIERKARWRAGLGSWRAEAYSRQTIRAGGDVVGVIEAQTLAYWDRGRGVREIVQAVNRTGNFESVPLDLFTAADQTLNLYDDEIAFAGFDLMGPTSPRALSFYRFQIVGTRALGTQLVFDLSFEPRNSLQPGLTGTLAVLADADAMIAVSAAPSQAVQFPIVRQFDVQFDQQFSPFGLDVGGEAVWLPVDFRMDTRGKAGTALIQIPDIGFAVSSRFTDYAVNVAVPDSLFEREGALVDSASVARALPVAGVVPLSAEEERALVDVDSTLSLTEAFRPTGPLARFFPVTITVAGASSGEPPRGLRFDRSFGARYNRVEGAVVNAFGTARLGGHSATLGVGYETGLEDVIASLGVVSRLSTEAFVGAEVHRDVSALGRTVWVDRQTNSLSALAFGEDYFDYVGRLGGWAWLGWWSQDAPFAHGQIWAALDDYDALPVTTEFSLTGDLSPVTVATVPNGVARAGVQLRIGTWAEGLPFGLTDQRAAALWVEGGRRWDGLSPVETAEYGRVEAEVRWSQPTVLRRRLLPPTLHLRLAAGGATGPLPVTRSFGIDGRLAGVSTFGALRARSGLALVREYALVAWEHDFRSVPFELVGWRSAAPLGVSLQVHGAHAWGTGADGALRTEPSLVHHEVGASVGFGFEVPLRLDVTYRLTDGPGAVVGVGVARLF